MSPSFSVKEQTHSKNTGRALKAFTFVDMLCRGGLRVEKGETEEREERQSSPLGHHFSQINLCRLQEPPEKLVYKKKSLKSPPATSWKMHKWGEKKVQSPKMCRNIQSQVLLKLAG